MTYINMEMHGISHIWWNTHKKKNHAYMINWHKLGCRAVKFITKVIVFH